MFYLFIYFEWKFFFQPNLNQKQSVLDHQLDSCFCARRHLSLVMAPNIVEKGLPRVLRLKFFYETSEECFCVFMAQFSCPFEILLLRSQCCVCMASRDVINGFLCFCYAMFGNLSHCKARNQNMEVALNSVVWDGVIGLFFFIFNLSNFKLMQEIISYILVVLAVLFLVKKYIFPSKKNSKCKSGCGCK